MSLLSNQSYANPATPLWASVNSSPVSTPVSQLFQYVVPSGTPGGASPGAMAFYPRPINSGLPALVDGNSTAIIGCSLFNNQITLPAGTYYIEANCVGLMETQQVRLFDTTNTSVIATGMSVGTAGRNNISTVMCEVTFVESTVIEVQFAGSQAFGNQDWGQASGLGDEVYLQCLITKEL